MPPQGSFGASARPAAVIVLSEGGQLMVHDLHTLQPVPLSLPFQELPAITASAFMPGDIAEEVGQNDEKEDSPLFSVAVLLRGCS